MVTASWTLLTGLWCDAQITGPVVVPFNLEKQTALLSVMARNFPRLSLGLGPVQTRVVSVIDDAAAQTTQVTLITVSNGGAQAFAEVQHGLCLSRACNMTLLCHALNSKRSKIYVLLQLVCLLVSHLGFTCSAAFATESALCQCWLLTSVGLHLTHAPVCAAADDAVPVVLAGQPVRRGPAIHQLHRAVADDCIRLHSARPGARHGPATQPRMSLSDDVIILDMLDIMHGLVLVRLQGPSQLGPTAIAKHMQADAVPLTKSCSCCSCLLKLDGLLLRPDHRL